MADGKVMQKYFPPDFDPEKLKEKSHLLRALRQRRGQKRGRRMMEMRMMFPFTLCCENCKDFVYVGTKFNSKVEKIRGEDYLGIPIWRFYGRCPHCRHEIRFRTDPQNTDYLLESGGSRTHNPHRDAILAESKMSEVREEELEGDTMRLLEHKSYSAAEELKSLEALEELRRLSKRLMSAPDQLNDKLLEDIKQRANNEDIGDLVENEEDLELARIAFEVRDQGCNSSSNEDEEEIQKVEERTSSTSSTMNLLDYGSEEEDAPVKKMPKIGNSGKPSFFELFK